MAAPGPAFGGPRMVQLALPCFPTRSRSGPLTKETTIYRVMGTAAASGSPLLAPGGH